MLNSYAPDFEALDQEGKQHRLSDYGGKWVVLYFYPRDNTAGCTKEACNFRDSWRDLAKMGVVVLGVSKDSVKSHKNFAQKYSLNFPILSDEDKKIVRSYKVLKKKKFMGREYVGVARMTYLVNPGGKIAKIYKKVNPLTHVSQIIRDLEELRIEN